MKKLILLLVFVIIATGCENDSFNNNNPYIPSYQFTFQLDMNLPLYSQLQFPSNAFFYSRSLDPNAGVRGVIVFNTGSGYNAFDAACPNQALADCSTMTISGIFATCPCDDVDYSLFTGQASGQQYPMKQYRVQKSGNILTIYN